MKDKAFKIVSDSKYDGYQKGLASMVYKFFDKKSSGSGITNEPNYQLADEIRKQLLKNLNKQKLIHHLETIFLVFIQLICNHWANITKKLSIYYVQLIFLVNTHGLFL